MLYALVERNTVHGTQVDVFKSLSEAQDKQKEYSRSHNSEIIKVENLKVHDGYYDEDIKAAIVEVSAELNENPICADFIVQLSGGNYLPQMGCLITIGERGYTDFDKEEEERILYEAVMKCDDYSGIAETAKKAYDYYLKEDVFDDGGDWEEVQGWAKPHETYIPVCATAHAEWILEEDKKYNEDENGYCETARYRLRVEKTGYIGLNDYASFPDFTVEYFDSIEEAKKEIMNK